TRAQRADTGLQAAAELRTFSKTLLGVRATRKTVAFADAQFYEDTNLELALNRTETQVAGTFRHELTPLTSLTVDFARQNDRFEFNPSRDADSTRIDGGVRFNRFALITGSAQAGYRDFNPLSPDIPGYSGLVLSASLSYVALGSTKLGFGASRDIQYSYDDEQPYYLQTGIEATIAQQIYGPVDAEARIGSRRLAYEDSLVGEVDVENRVDQIRNFGGGIGYRTSRDLRIAFTAEKTHRRSEIDDRQYDDLRYGVTITYGLQ
ncbi:MAG TPA: outer membrane beta-barrel protein, partial [Pirellulaceae bacterium]